MHDVVNHVDDGGGCDEKLPGRKLTDVKLYTSYGLLLVPTKLLSKKRARHYICSALAGWDETVCKF